MLDTITICIIGIIGIILFIAYNYLKTHENFELQESIEKVLVDYDSEIANTKLIKGPNPVTFWKPLLSNGLYSIGSAVSRDTNSRPDKQYTAIKGTDIKNVVDYTLVYKMGRTYMEINRDITNVNADIVNNNNLIMTNQAFIDLYNNANPDMAVGEIDRDGASTTGQSFNVFRNLVTDESNYISQPNKYPDANKYKQSYTAYGLNKVTLHPHTMITVTLPYFKTNGRFDTAGNALGAYENQTRTIEADYQTLSKLTLTEGKFATQTFDMATVLENGMNADVRVVYSKNPKALEYWTKLVTTAKENLVTLNEKKTVLNIESKSGKFSIWTPTPADGYIALGGIIMNSHEKPQLNDVKCVPKRCTKRSRDWKPKDIVHVSENSGKRLTIYQNPFSMTLDVKYEKLVNNTWTIINNTINDGVYRLFPCVAKCDYVDTLIKADECSKNMCTKKANDLDSIKLVSNVVDYEIDSNLLGELKENDDYIKTLQNKINEVITNTNNYNVISTERNRHQLSDHIDSTGKLHKDAINKLYNSKDSLAININAPNGINDLKNILTGYIGTGNVPQKTFDSSSCTNWDDFKKNYYCKKSTPPCYGCSGLD